MLFILLMIVLCEAKSLLPDRYVTRGELDVYGEELDDEAAVRRYYDQIGKFELRLQAQLLVITFIGYGIVGALLSLVGVCMAYMEAGVRRLAANNAVQNKEIPMIQTRKVI